MSIFRWFDSGDLQGSWHLESIMRIVNNVRSRGGAIKHWIPTHEADIAVDYASKNKIPDDVALRVSSDMVNDLGDTERILNNGLVMSCVYDKSRLLEATKECLDRKITFAVCTAKTNPDSSPSGRENRCGPCRLCWNTNIQMIIYPKH